MKGVSALRVNSICFDTSSSLLSRKNYIVQDILRYWEERRKSVSNTDNNRIVLKRESWSLFYAECEKQ